MKLLIVSQYFWPENFRINDLAEALKTRGHEVTVLTGLPNYPAGQFFEGYGFFRRVRETWRGVEIVHSPLWARGRGGGIRLGLNYLSFAWFPSIVARFRLRGPFDAVFAFEVSPITVGIPAIVASRRFKAPKLQLAIAEYDDAHPNRVLYVSIIDQYKHQWHVVEAVAALRKQGFPIVLDLMGPAYPAALKRLNQTIDRVDAERRWVHYHGAIPFNELHLRYAAADLGLFASSCENMLNILLETMASGLPIACSNREPMPEVLGQAGVFFNPEQSEDIARALRELIESPQIRTELARASYERVQEYSWQRCADETFEFLVGVVQQRKRNYRCLKIKIY